jgi:hypothetical protein
MVIGTCNWFNEGFLFQVCSFKSWNARLPEFQLGSSSSFRRALSHIRFDSCKLLQAGEEVE